MTDKSAAHQLTRLIQGFVALCLGSSERLVWMTQPDAAAFSDADHLYLPTPTGVQGERELLLSIAMREVARVTHSDAPSFQQAQTEFAGYAASIEDARIKQAISNEYKGAPSIFDAATEVVHRVAMDALSSPGADPEQLKQFAIWFAANDALLGTPVSNAAAVDIVELASRQLDASALQRAIGMSQASPFLGSTHAAVSCASRIHALLHSPEPEQQSSPSEESLQDEQKGDQPQALDECPSDPPPGDTGERGSDSAQPSEDQSAGDNQPPNQQSQQQPTSTEQSEGQGQSDKDTASDQQSGPWIGEQCDQSEGASGQQGAESGSTPLSSDPMSNALAMLKGFSGARDVSATQRTGDQVGDVADDSLMQALAQTLADPTAMQRVNDMLLPTVDTAPEADDCQQQPREVEVQSQDDGELDGLEAMAGLCASSGYAPVTYLPQSNTLDAIPGRLVNVLLRELNDKRPTKILKRESGHDINVANFWRLKRLGDTRVFRKKSPSSGVDAAVEILLDRSGSMKGSIKSAANTANAFALALQRISGVQTAIDLFPGGSGPVENILKFKQNPTQATAKLREVCASGGTPTDQAIRAVLPGLLNAHALKRVIVLITDGDPDDEFATRLAIAQADDMGIDFIGIGIGGRVKIENILPGRCKTISDVNDLPNALEELFKTKLSTSLLAA